MGWIRDLMLQASPEVPSFGRLAALSLAHPKWPNYVRPQERSLASLFSKLDRGLELEWLQDRPEVQHVLQQILGCSENALSRSLSRGLERSSQSSNTWRFDTAPAARPLQLTDESLPPGIPEILQRPGAWGRCVWSARHPNEIQLVGRWLQARGLAEVRRSGAIPSAEGAESALFLILDAAESDDAFPGGALADWPERRNTCVATSRPELVPSGWRRLDTPVPVTWVDELVDWLAARLPADGRFSPDAARATLRRAARDELLDSFESALGLAATLDELGPEAQALGWGQLAQRYVDHRVAQAPGDGRTEGSWLREHGYAALAGLVQSAVSDPASSWDAARSEERWRELVPLEFQRGIDSDWARVALTRADQPLSVEELELALTRVPPGAFRVVRALESARLLQGNESGLRVEPRWLASWLRQLAEEQLLAGTPERWGELLLNRDSRDAVRRRLARELSREDSPLLDALLELDATDDPSLVIALECVFEVTGHAVLRREEFSSEQLESLWAANAEQWIVLSDDRVVPRLLASPVDAARYGSWLLAAWALSETIASSIELPCVNPWAAVQQLPLAALDAVHAHLTSPAEPGEDAAETLASSLSLVRRLFGSRVTQISHPLLLVPRLFEDTSWDDWETLAKHPVYLELVVQLSDDAFVELAYNAWSAWTNNGRPDGAHPLTPEESTSGRFWEHLPLEVLEEMLNEAHPFVDRAPHARLGEAQLLLTIRKSIERPRPQLLQRLWARHRTEVLGELLDRIEAQAWSQVDVMLANAPREPIPQLLALLRERLAQHGVSDPLPELARSWLQNVASGDHTGRLEAYSLLAEIERRLARVRLARGRPGGATSDEAI